VNAYATIARRGFSTPPLLVLRVRDRRGQVLEENEPPSPPETYTAATAANPISRAAAEGRGEGDRAPAALPVLPFAPAGGEPAVLGVPSSGLEPEVAYVLSSMMRDVVEYGTGAAARSLGRPLAGKTGTAQDHRDAWFVGFAPDLVAGVWVGFDSHEPLGTHETGAGAALPAWMSFMRAALARHPVTEFQAPPNVEFARVDARTGLLAADPSAPDAPLVAFVAGTTPRSAADQATGPAPQSFFMDDH
jgi:penicillin-binding protein 1A